MHADAMNTQVHETTGTSPYELVFGQKPRSVLFPTSTAVGVILEEDLMDDGLHLEVRAEKPDEGQDTPAADEDNTCKMITNPGIKGSTNGLCMGEESHLTTEAENPVEGLDTPPLADEDSTQEMEIMSLGTERSTTALRMGEKSNLVVEAEDPVEGLDTPPSAVEDSIQEMEITNPGIEGSTTGLRMGEKSDLVVEAEKPVDERDTLAAEDSDFEMKTKSDRRRQTSVFAENHGGIATADGHRQQTLSMRERALSTTKKHKEVSRCIPLYYMALIRTKIYILLQFVQCSI